MKNRHLVFNSLLFYRRTGIAVFLGVAAASAVLVGALLVGDSVRYSLRRLAILRLGDIHFAMNARGRFFDAQLNERVASATRIEAASVLRLEGVAIRPQGDTDGAPLQVNRVQVLGVDDSFGAFAPRNGAPFPAAGEVAINRKLARRLNMEVGDDLSLRIALPSILPRDAPLAEAGNQLSRRVLLKVSRVVEDENLGRFSLAAEQVAPYNAFVRRSWLQQQAEVEGRANLLLVGGPGAGDWTAADLQDRLAAVARLADFGIGFDGATQNMTVVSSRRIFFDPALTRAVLALPDAVGTLAYLVNSLSHTDREGALMTPYSFVVGCAPSDDQRVSPVPYEMGDDETIVNRWTADELRLTPGDEVQMAYYELTGANQFVERTRRFRVRAIREMDTLQFERKLMPEFPGLSDVESCSQWDVGLPMEEETLRNEANERYWQQYRDLPKAFVTLAAAQEMWANRFGNLTGARIPLGGEPSADAEARVSNAIDPAELGLFFVPVRAEALDAVAQSMDFGGLFIGLSFFLIVSALMLTGLLFVFGVEQRLPELGVLRAMGFTPGRLRMLLLLEGGLIAIAGASVGGIAGIYYTRALIGGLSQYWRGAVAGARIVYHGTAASMVSGILISAVCAATAILLATWRACRCSVVNLLMGAGDSNALGDLPGDRLKKWVVAAALSFAAAAGLVLFGIIGDQGQAVSVFFVAGALVLGGGMMASHVLFRRLTLRSGHTRLSIGSLAIKNLGRSTSRSLVVVGLLAAGCFLVFAVSSMQLDVTADARQRSSGTGGFDFFVRSTLPIPERLDTARGRKRLGLDRGEAMDGVRVIHMKIYEGDDASCFNLNRAQSPTLYGLEAARMSELRAFLPSEHSEDLWQRMGEERSDGAVSGLAGDADTAAWGLAGKGGADGDTLAYRDEAGHLFSVQLIGALPMRLSVFQGTVLLDLDAFSRRFPSIGGYQALLVDVPQGREDEVRDLLARRLDRFGVEIQATPDRLREFYSVQESYLSMFLVLGGLGLILGSMGMGVVAVRNVMERRGELAILRAVGYPRRTVRWMVLCEHWILLAAGMALGGVAAMIAIWPSIQAGGSRVPYGVMGLITLALAVSGLLLTTLGIFLSTRGRLLPALRKE